MRIEYNILWFEDSGAWLKPTKKALADFLDDYGFRLTTIDERDSSNVNELIWKIQNKHLDVDLIFMDYKLAKGSQGNVIIESIRKVELFTEILFYSYQTDVKKVIEREIGSTVEGIYFAERDNFLDKAKTVIKHTIKKVQEVNNVRGLIMSATSEIDSMMKEIIFRFYETFPDEIKEIVTKGIFEEVGKQVNSKKSNYEKFLRSKRIDKLIADNVMFDAMQKATATQLIINQLNHLEVLELKEQIFFNAYKNEVIKVRNDFAHVIEIFEDGKRKLKSKSSEEFFTDERCVEIRKLLIKHLDTVQLIKSILFEEKS